MAFVSFSCFGCMMETWTIHCMELRNSEHRESATAIARTLRAARGIRAFDVRVQHESDASHIYYGKYLRTIDGMTGERGPSFPMRSDLELIRELVDDQGRRLFMSARTVPEPTPDIGNPQWNLENAKGEYTLQVAAFQPAPELPNYKRAAIDFTADLRRKGFEAYYFHGPSNTVVTIGTFGPEAVIRRDGRTDYSSEVRRLQSQEHFKYNLTNGDIWYSVVNGRRAPVRSLLVRIPEQQVTLP